MRPRRLFALVGLGFALAGVGAHAATPGDPFEKLNRKFFAGTDLATKHYVAPIGRVYRALTPGPIGEGLHNFFVFLSEPAVVANDLLQLRVSRAGADLARLVTNAPLAGFVDLAASQGLPHQDNDFGVTLGRWGVGPGPYLFVPLLGPSTMRDAIGVGVDAAMSPLNYIRFHGRLTLSYSTTAVGAIDKVSHAGGELEAATADAADPYATLRSLYLQQREAQIHGDAAPALPPLDDPDSGPAPGPSARAVPAPHTASVATSETPVATRVLATAASDDPDAPIATAQPHDRAGAGAAMLVRAGSDAGAGA